MRPKKLLVLGAGGGLEQPQGRRIIAREPRASQAVGFLYCIGGHVSYFLGRHCPTALGKGARRQHAKHAACGTATNKIVQSIINLCESRPLLPCRTTMGLTKKQKLDNSAKGTRPLTSFFGPVLAEVRSKRLTG